MLLILILVEIGIINRLTKLAKQFGIQQRRTYAKEVKALRLNLRHFRHIKRRAKARAIALNFPAKYYLFTELIAQSSPKPFLFEAHLGRHSLK